MLCGLSIVVDSNVINHASEGLNKPTDVDWFTSTWRERSFSCRSRSNKLSVEVKLQSLTHLVGESYVIPRVEIHVNVGGRACHAVNGGSVSIVSDLTRVGPDRTIQTVLAVAVKPKRVTRNLGHNPRTVIRLSEVNPRLNRQLFPVAKSTQLLIIIGVVLVIEVACPAIADYYGVIFSIKHVGSTNNTVGNPNCTFNNAIVVVTRVINRRSLIPRVEWQKQLSYRIIVNFPAINVSHFVTVWVSCPLSRAIVSGRDFAFQGV